MIEKIELSRIVEKLESGSREKGGSIDSGIISIGGTHLSNNGGFKWDRKEYVSEDFYSKMRSGKIHNQDILIVKDGATTGKTSFVDETFPYKNAAINEHVFRLQINPKHANPKYVFYFLHSPVGQDQILNDFRGATVGGISRGFIDKIEIPIPDIETQNKIVAILDKAKAILDKREQTLQKYDELLKATFIEMFGDVTINPKKLPVQPLKKFGEVITGNTPPRSDNENYDSQFIEWIKTDNILSDSPILTQATEYLSEKGFSRARYVDENALLVACIAGSLSSIGRAAISDRRVAYNQQINAIVPSSDVSVHFLYWLFKVSTEYIQSFATSGMKKLLTKGEFEKIPLIKPDYQEQLKFENIALFYSQLRDKLKKHHIQAEQLLKSLSQQVFNERITIDVDTELEALVNTIDIDKKDEENSISTLLNDVTYLQRLIDRLQAQEFADDEQYEKAKYILFRIMKEEPDLVKQKYDSETKKIILTI